jgi:hypothetical protein
MLSKAIFRNIMFKAKHNLVVIGIVIFFLFLLFTFIIGENKDKKIDKELWRPWLLITADRIKKIELSPINDKGYITISNCLIIEKRTLISEIKEYMNRKIMTEKDKPGYHWFSKKRICLSAYLNGKKYSFLLFFHDDFSSIQYQMLSKEGGSQYDTIGEGWRSAKLYDLIGGLIESNQSIEWVDSQSVRTGSNRVHSQLGGTKGTPLTN